MAKTQQHVSGVGTIRKKELIPFTRQMASMMNAGLPILTSISTLEEQCQHPGFRQVLRSLRDVIESGTPFSEGLAMYPRIFDSMYVNMVAAGEESGQFASVRDKRFRECLPRFDGAVADQPAQRFYPTRSS